MSFASRVFARAAVKAVRPVGLRTVQRPTIRAVRMFSSSRTQYEGMRFMIELLEGN